MILRATIQRVPEGILARCLENDRSALGSTEGEALDKLRVALFAYYTRVRSVAPPGDPPDVEIELVVVQRDGT